MPTAPMPQTSRKSRSRAPATKSTAVPVTQSTTAAPKSGSMSSRTAAATSTASGLKKPCADAAKLGLVAHGVDRHVSHEKPARDLRRLEVQRPDPDPPLAAVDLMADSRDQHEDEEREARDQQPGREPLPDRDRHDEQRGAERAAEQDGEKLPLEMEERVAHRALGDVQGRRGNHHQADEQQAEDRGDDYRVDCQPLLAARRA